METDNVIILASTLFPSTCLLAAAIVIAFHHDRQADIIILNQTVNPTPNYDILLQPPLVRICSSVCNHGLPEIHKLPGICQQQTAEDVADLNEESIPETRISTCPGTPVIALSLTTSSSSAESTPYVIQSPSPIAAPYLAKQLHRFQVVWRGIKRPSTPYPRSLTSNHTRNVNVCGESLVPDSDDPWESITPSAFLFISTFIPPRELHPDTPAPVNIPDLAYPSIVNWDQLVSPQPEDIPNEERSTPITEQPARSAWQQINE